MTRKRKNINEPNQLKRLNKLLGKQVKGKLKSIHTMSRRSRAAFIESSSRLRQEHIEGKLVFVSSSGRSAYLSNDGGDSGWWCDPKSVQKI